MASASTAHLTDIASSLASITPDSQRSLERANRSLHLQHHKVFSSATLPQEDRDAALTGSTRSLARRLFALNVHDQVAQPIPVSPHCLSTTSLRRSA